MPLTITIEPVELFDEEKLEFLTVDKPVTLELEHSLISLSKWEMKWKKPFLTKEGITGEMFLDYVRCMTIKPQIPFEKYGALTMEQLNTIKTYIEDPMTATWFGKRPAEKHKSPKKPEIMTNERIYQRMVEWGIPFSCEKWHLNRLLTLIRCCQEENTPFQKRSMKQLMTDNRALNEARKRKLGTRG